MRAFLAVACAVAAIALTIVFVACGGSVETEVPAECGSPHEDVVDAGIVEVGPGWWVDVFDASKYSGFDPPVVGEYPPSGSSACEYSGCFPQGTCDPQTGWCCSGDMRKAACSCGVEAGCVPPSVCCALPGALELQCVATPDECPDAR